MQKTLEYLHEIYKETHDPDIKTKVALLGETLRVAQDGWNAYFLLSVKSTMEAKNETIRIGVFNCIFSTTDRIFNWSNKKISYIFGSKIELICLLRNIITHGNSDFPFSSWSGYGGGIAHMTFLHLEDIDMFDTIINARGRGFRDWINDYEKSHKETYWNEEWFRNSRNQIIQEALNINKDDLEKIDIELYVMASAYFNPYLN